MSSINLISTLEKKNTESVYISLYSIIYLTELLLEREDNKTNKKKGLGSMIDKIIIEREDFKELINRHFERGKL